MCYWIHWLFYWSYSKYENQNGCTEYIVLCRRCGKQWKRTIQELGWGCTHDTGYVEKR